MEEVFWGVVVMRMKGSKPRWRKSASGAPVGWGTRTPEGLSHHFLPSARTVLTRQTDPHSVHHSPADCMLPFPLYREGNGGTEKVTDLSKFMQLGEERRQRASAPWVLFPELSGGDDLETCLTWVPDLVGLPDRSTHCIELQGGFLTTGPPGKPLLQFKKNPN